MGSIRAASAAGEFCGHHLLRRQRWHPPAHAFRSERHEPGSPGVRPYPAFGEVSWRGNKDSSNYEGLSVSVKRTFTHGFLFSANYTWSHEIDDGSDGSGDPDSLVPENVACPRCERASGIWDVRHVLNANVIYQLPFGPGKPYLNQPGIWGKIAGSWELTSTVLARTGFPVNVLINRSASAVPDGNTTDQRPDLVPGVSLTPTGGSSIGRMDQSRCLRRPGERYIRRRAAGRGAWAGRMADRHGDGETHSVERAGAT